MKKLILIFLIGLLISCGNTLDFNDAIQSNSEQVFGVTFSSDQDWNTTTNSSIIINGAEKVQILASFQEDSIVDLRLLNESKGGTITFDVPNNYSNLYAIIYNNGIRTYKKFNLGETSLKTRGTRGVISKITPSGNPVITGTVESFANQRGWLPGEVFYTYNYVTEHSEDYSSDFKELFNDIIFNYFPNGRKYNNLPQIKKSGYYNENVYPITTGDKPIIISPVYKNDGGYHEISEAELYYYYFKGDLTASEIEALPKYRAVDLSEVYTNDNNCNILKDKSYVLVYWNGNEGSYQFPAGYKIGFMYKSNTTYEKPKKQGEVYGDGRLNYNINNWGNFKSSGLGDTDPRMAWMSINEKMFLCIESGTDKDFNDLIVEVEGGIKPIIIIPDDPENQFYTFLFEDHRLGDYDLNDVVLKGCRVDETTVEWTLMACGASDELYIKGIDGNTINENTEVHELFKKQKGVFVNTQKGDNTPFVKDIVTVSKDFSFLKNQPYIYDRTKDWEVRIATVGQDPHAIMIPYDFKWSLERICIKDSYPLFNNWGTNKIISTDWYKFPDENKIY